MTVIILIMLIGGIHGTIYILLFLFLSVIILLHLKSSIVSQNYFSVPFHLLVPKLIEGTGCESRNLESGETIGLSLMSKVPFT